jgi:uncharacterized protein
MKVWVDRSVMTIIRANDCTAPVHIAPIRFPPSEKKACHIRNRLLMHSPSLYIQPCLDGMWLICNPEESGRFAVLDLEAFLMFKKFDGGNTPLSVTNSICEESLISVGLLAAFLYELGFLQEVNREYPVNYQCQEDTLTAWLHVTNACSLRCHYCYISKTNEAMADDTARRAVDAVIRSARKQHFRRIMLKYAGGEASLRPDSIFAMHDYAVEQAHQYNLEVDAHLLSNGVFLPQNTIEQLKKRHIAISISLDGIGMYHDTQRSFVNGKGSFKFVDRTIKRLLANGIPPHILITVSQSNLPGLLDLMHYILEHELSFTFSYYRENECSTSRHDLQFSNEQMIGTMRDVFTLIEQQLPRQSLLNALIDKVDLSHTHKNTCGVGRNSLVIDQRGGVARCQADIKQVVTTIDADDPLQILKQDPSGIRNLSVEEKQGCQQCTWRHWCAGGCPLLTYKMTGRYDIKSPNCSIYQALIPDALRLEALRLLAYAEPLLVSSETETYEMSSCPVKVASW